MKQFLIAVDQLANTMIGGMADETLSARAYRTNSFMQHVINALFFDRNHCRDSYFSELNRKQLPKEYFNG